MNFTSENEQIANELKLANGYLACEKIILNNILKRFEFGLDDASIENYLKELVTHLEIIIETGKESNFHINYRFAAGFINTLLKVPAWREWVNTIEI